jgi:CBS domain-containing protein
MNIGSLCRRAIVSIDTGCTLRQAAKLMLSNHVGALLVTVEADGRRDAVGLVIACVARELSPSEVFVGAIATHPLHSAPSSATAEEAAEILNAAGVRRLLVVDDAGEVTGLLSSDDVLSALLEPLKSLANCLRVNISREEVLRSTAAHFSPRRLFLPVEQPVIVA